MAPINSSAVQRLRKAGGIVLGSSNMDEMGMGSWGKYGYGRTHVKNPIDEAHFAGGSSAGSAAAVKSYQLVLTLEGP
jgi:aspartyl-tRNA(Asn)/glutamyl-tRNA(Gln) amidotransferase subunit A